jgi:hypothetical protein
MGCASWWTPDQVTNRHFVREEPLWCTDIKSPQGSFISLAEVLLQQ